jgi:myo-inositol-1(or 4)-monophosphatase
MNYQSFITSVLKEASEIAKEKFGKVSSTIKGGDSNQVLTEADIAIGAYIIQKIKKEYPEYNIIDEEAGAVDNKSEFTWVIDPIDGTSNFANGVPTYGIMLGLLKDATPLAGGIALPYFDQICFAVLGKGAFCNDKKITVTQEKQLINSLVSYGMDGYQNEPEITFNETKLLGEIILKVRNFRNSNCCFDILMVASGSFAGALNRTSRIWDNVAPQILIEEAGGLYTDFLGKPVDYANPLKKISKNYTYCAASPALHKQLQKIIHEFGVFDT